MKWQDIVIAGCQLSFVFALWPSIRSKDKPALASCVSTTFLTAIITFCMYSLHLWFAMFTGSLVSLAWLTLSIQGYKLRKIKQPRITNH